MTEKPIKPIKEKETEATTTAIETEKVVKKKSKKTAVHVKAFVQWPRESGLLRWLRLSRLWV